MIKNKALLIVDLQLDFLKGGALEVPAGNQVISPILDIASSFGSIILTQDWHPAGHKSFASSHKNKKPGDTIIWKGKEEILWPDHCIQQTQGAAIHPDIAALHPSAIIQKGTDSEVDSYSSFFDNHRLKETSLDGYLKENRISELSICGLATDYCVLFSVLDALSLGYEVEVIKTACRGVNISKYDSEIAFQRMKEAGAKISE